MHCAACAVRNERTLRKMPGVLEANVNLGTRRARIAFDETAVTEAALRGAVIDNGYEILTDDDAANPRGLAQREVQTARQRAFWAIALGAPVMVLAMADIQLPWSYLGRNLSVWLQAILSSAVILGLGFDFHRGMVTQARSLAANMDTLISLGTLAALLFSLWGMWIGSHHLYFETGAVIAALILLGRYFEARSRGQAGHRATDGTRRKDGAPDRIRRGARYSDRAGKGRRRPAGAPRRENPGGRHRHARRLQRR
jgi:cation transport ATPase